MVYKNYKKTNASFSRRLSLIRGIISFVPFFRRYNTLEYTEKQLKYIQVLKNTFKHSEKYRCKIKDVIDVMICNHIL